MNYRTHRLLSISLYLIVAGLVYLVPVGIHHSLDLFRLIRPIQDISREEWAEHYLLIFLLSIVLVYLISTLFYLLETYIYLTAKFWRMLFHVILLAIVIVGANIIVSRLIPFAPGLGFRVFGTLSIVLVVQSIIYLTVLPPSHYRGLLRK